LPKGGRLCVDKFAILASLGLRYPLRGNRDGLAEKSDTQKIDDIAEGQVTQSGVTIMERKISL
jgi:hypothetical protein